jgi:diaminopimelate epimerase
MIDQIFYTEGAGNSFFFTLSNVLEFSDLRLRSKDLGLDPDGFIVSKRVKKDLVSFEFYNKDGGRVDFCGNALRAVGLCYQKITGESQVNLKTQVGVLSVEVLENGLVKAQMPQPVFKSKVSINGVEASYIESGVPHIVFNLKDLGFLDRASIRQFSHEVRKIDLKGMETYNLTYYDTSASPHFCVTFERGVEDFTKACGSGALSVFKTLGDEDIRLQMPGGLLEILSKKEEIFMVGPANIIEVYS